MQSMSTGTEQDFSHEEPPTPIWFSLLGISAISLATTLALAVVAPDGFASRDLSSSESTAEAQNPTDNADAQTPALDEGQADPEADIKDLPQRRDGESAAAQAPTDHNEKLPPGHHIATPTLRQGDAVAAGNTGRASPSSPRPAPLTPEGTAQAPSPSAPTPSAAKNAGTAPTKPSASPAAAAVTAPAGNTGPAGEAPSRAPSAAVPEKPAAPSQPATPSPSVAPSSPATPSPSVAPSSPVTPSPSVAPRAP